MIDRDTGQAKPRRKGAKYLDTLSGRIRLAMIADNSAASIEVFVRANVKRGTTLLTDGHASYSGLTDYRHDPRVSEPRRSGVHHVAERQRAACAQTAPAKPGPTTEFRLRKQGSRYM
jgi:ISXO2-like transposase domain